MMYVPRAYNFSQRAELRDLAAVEDVGGACYIVYSL